MGPTNVSNWETLLFEERVSEIIIQKKNNKNRPQPTLKSHIAINANVRDIERR